MHPATSRRRDVEKRSLGMLRRCPHVPVPRTIDLKTLHDSSPVILGPKASALCTAGALRNVSTDGFDFAAKHPEHILTPFQRLQMGDEYVGTEMGLAICRRIADRHRGTLTAPSTSGRGSGRHKLDMLGLIRPLVRLQEQEPALRWTYVWLAVGGLLLVLTVLAFAYFLVKRRWQWLGRLLGHPAFQTIDRQLSARLPRLWRFVRQRFSIHQWHGLVLTVAASVLFSTTYLFALITESWAGEETLYAFDRRIYDWLVGAMHPSVAAFMRSVTHFGDTLVIVAVAVATGAYLLHRKHRWRVAGLVVAVGGGSAIMWGLKWIFARSRPKAQLAAAMGHSFPSGHAFNSVTLYGFLIYLTLRMVERDAVRIGITIVLVALVFLIGLRRMSITATTALPGSPAPRSARRAPS